MYQQITSNKRKSVVLLFGFLLLYGALGWLFSLWFGPAAFYIASLPMLLAAAAVMFMGWLYQGGRGV